MKNVNSGRHDARRQDAEKRAKMRLAGDHDLTPWGFIVENWEWVIVGCLLAFVVVFLTW
jgi:hypothetical protein